MNHFTFRVKLDDFYTFITHLYLNRTWIIRYLYSIQIDLNIHLNYDIYPLYLGLLKSTWIIKYLSMHYTYVSIKAFESIHFSNGKQRDRYLYIIYHLYITYLYTTYLYTLYVYISLYIVHFYAYYTSLFIIYISIHLYIIYQHLNVNLSHNQIRTQCSLPSEKMRLTEYLDVCGYMWIYMRIYLWR